MWTSKFKVLQYISLLNGTYGKYESYSKGCLKFYRLLKFAFPEAVGYYNSDHVITKIGESYFDQNGLVENIEGYTTLESYGKAYFKNSFGIDLTGFI